MSGWPTTIAPLPTGGECIVTAARAGTPARLSIVRASAVDSGRFTFDGYPIPAATVLSYVVKGPGVIEVITDTSEQPGGVVATETCTALTLAGADQVSGSGCTA